MKLDPAFKQLLMDIAMISYEQGYSEGAMCIVDNKAKVMKKGYELIMEVVKKVEVDEVPKHVN